MNKKQKEKFWENMRRQFMGTTFLGMGLAFGFFSFVGASGLAMLGGISELGGLLIGMVVAVFNTLLVFEAFSNEFGLNEN